MLTRSVGILAEYQDGIEASCRQLTKECLAKARWSTHDRPPRRGGGQTMAPANDPARVTMILQNLVVDKWRVA
jgi:hypothetical protein